MTQDQITGGVRSGVEYRSNAPRSPGQLKPDTSGSALALIDISGGEIVKEIAGTRGVARL